MAGGIDSLESTPRFLKTLKIPSLAYEDQRELNINRPIIFFWGPTGDTVLVKSGEKTGPKHCRDGLGEKVKDDRKQITFVT